MVESVSNTDFPAGPARTFVERTRGAYTYYSGDTPCVWFIGTRLTVAQFARLYANPTMRAALEVLSRAHLHAQETDPHQGGFDFSVSYTPPGTTIRVPRLVDRPYSGMTAHAGQTGGPGESQVGDGDPDGDPAGDPGDGRAVVWCDELVELVPGWRYSLGIGGRHCGSADGIPGEEQAWVALVAFAAHIVDFADPMVAAS